MTVRTMGTTVLLLGLAGCMSYNDDLGARCLKQHPGDTLRCCDPGDHVDNGICCPPYTHEVTDFEHPDWKICVLDGWHIDRDAGADAP